MIEKEAEVNVEEEVVEDMKLVKNVLKMKLEYGTKLKELQKREELLRVKEKEVEKNLIESRNQKQKLINMETDLRIREEEVNKLQEKFKI